MRGNRLCISTLSLATGPHQGPEDDQRQEADVGGDELVVGPPSRGGPYSHACGADVLISTEGQRGLACNVDYNPRLEQGRPLAWSCQQPSRLRLLRGQTA